MSKVLDAIAGNYEGMLENWKVWSKLCVLGKLLT